MITETDVVTMETKVNNNVSVKPANTIKNEGVSEVKVMLVEHTFLTRGMRTLEHNNRM